MSIPETTTFARRTLVFNRSRAPVWLRWLSLGLACCDRALAAFLRVGRIGTCGPIGARGTCNP